MSSTSRHGSPRLLAVCLGACVLVVLGVGTAAAQTTTTLPPDTVATTVPPPSTTAVPSTTVAPALERRVSDSEDATTRLNRAVIGLLLLAGVITVVTVVFWRMTRPRSGSSTRQTAFWVDGGGAEVPLPGDDPAGGGPGVDPGSWSVGPPPSIPDDAAADTADPDGDTRHAAVVERPDPEWSAPGPSGGGTGGSGGR